MLSCFYSHWFCSCQTLGWSSEISNNATVLSQNVFGPKNRTTAVHHPSISLRNSALHSVKFACFEKIHLIVNITWRQRFCESSNVQTWLCKAESMPPSLRLKRHREIFNSNSRTHLRICFTLRLSAFLFPSKSLFAFQLHFPHQDFLTLLHTHKILIFKYLSDKHPQDLTRIPSTCEIFTFSLNNWWLHPCLGTFCEPSCGIPPSMT